MEDLKAKIEQDYGREVLSIDLEQGRAILAPEYPDQLCHGVDCGEECKCHLNSTIEIDKFL